jgi:hypothetical protein
VRVLRKTDSGGELYGLCVDCGVPTDEQGWARLEQLPPGTYLLRGHGLDGIRGETARFEVQEGMTTTIRLKLKLPP